MEPVRYHDLDALRAYAMLLGILLHAVLSFNFTPIWPAQDKFQDADFQVINNSIHGFRMQLFFLVSGFFTCMMWLKRGSIGLVWHRFKRILLPLFLFSLFIIPALTHMPELAAKKREAEKQQAGEQSKVRELTSRSSIWDASKSGDLNRVRELIDNGANINRPKPGLIRPTPLHNASAAGHPEIVTLLLKSGADIDAGDIGDSTPLHWAALMGQADSVRLLMEAGASPDRKNREGETPVQSAELEQGMTQLAIGVLQMPVPIKDVMAGRNKVKALLQGG
ncbi:MAG: ankyrin repeat domain-containing protein, partial [Verrucomicrobiota bacterium]|nr:ankyrin repeat domain-containing protein [Verrucomicrobiota bacterium]